MDTFTQFEGDKDKLGDAEKFFIELMKLPEYELRIEAMILKGEFNSLLGSIRPNIQILNQACRKLYDNHSLKTFLRYILHIGNFINKVSYMYNKYMQILCVCLVQISDCVSTKQVP